MAHDKEKKVPAVSLCSLCAAGTALGGAGLWLRGEEKVSWLAKLLLHTSSRTLPLPLPLVTLLREAPGGAIGGCSSCSLSPQHPASFPLCDQLPQLLHFGPSQLKLTLCHLPGTCILAL